MRLCEAGTVAIVGAAGELGFFASDDPAEFVLGLLATVRAGHGVSPLLGALVEKITLFHLHLAGLRLVLGSRIPLSPAVTGPREDEYCIIAEGFAAGKKDAPRGVHE